MNKNNDFKNNIFAMTKACKRINIQANDRNIEIPIFLKSINFKEYRSAFEESKDCRKNFCIMIYSMINNFRNLDKNQSLIIDLDLNDIEKFNDEVLIKIGNSMINEMNCLKKYYRQEKGKTYFENFKVLVLKFLEELYEEREDRWRELTEREKKLSEKMIKNGWYFSLNLSLDAHNLLEIDNKNYIDEILTEFYEQYEDIMFSKVIENNSKRKLILQKAFDAHKVGDFELSIPVMLIQCDGISNEIFQMGFFNKRDGKPKTVNQGVIKFDDNFADICFKRQLEICGELNESKEYSDCLEGERLNRHLVLHGFDVDYANKTNSMKCLVALNFLTEIKLNYNLNNKRKIK